MFHMRNFWTIAFPCYFVILTSLLEDWNQEFATCNTPAGKWKMRSFYVEPKKKEQGMFRMRNFWTIAFPCYFVILTSLLEDWNQEFATCNTPAGKWKMRSFYVEPKKKEQGMFRMRNFWTIAFPCYFVILTSLLEDCLQHSCRKMENEIILRRAKEKRARYVSHEEFLDNCISMLFFDKLYHFSVANLVLLRRVSGTVKRYLRQ